MNSSNVRLYAKNIIPKGPLTLNLRSILSPKRSECKSSNVNWDRSKLELIWGLISSAVYFSTYVQVQSAQNTWTRSFTRVWAYLRKVELGIRETFLRCKLKSVLARITTTTNNVTQQNVVVSRWSSMFQQVNWRLLFSSPGQSYNHV